MARTLVCLNALWILLSRPDLPEVVAWPPAFWTHVSPFARWRFLLFGLPASVETALHALALLSLILTLLGVLPRLSAAVAAILLYHFAPLENVFSVHTGPHFRGLTIPILALWILAFAEVPRLGMAASGELRWPFALIQLELAFIYLFSGIAKLHTVGWHWMEGSNIQGLILSMALPGATPPWAVEAARSEWICRAMGLGGMFMDFVVVLAVFFRRAAVFVVPMLFVAHFAIAKVYGVLFLNLPLLLLFVDWEGTLEKARRIFR
jgi:hypothetical protein